MRNSFPASQWDYLGERWEHLVTAVLRQSSQVSARAPFQVLTTPAALQRIFLPAKYIQQEEGSKFDLMGIVIFWSFGEVLLFRRKSNS